MKSEWAVLDSRWLLTEVRRLEARSRSPVQAYARAALAMPIGNHELYVSWIDPTQNDALVDVFVMNFKTHVVFDYAPGSLKPESSGFITVRKRGAERLP